MDFYGTEICFKTLLKGSIFAEISDPRQKFLLNCLSWSKSFSSQNANFHGVPPRPVEISGRRNWANVGNLAHFAQKATKKQQMLKNDVFWHFWRWSIFEKFLTHKSKFSKTPPESQKFLHISKMIKMAQIGIKDVFSTPARVFGPILASVSIWE